MLRRGIFWPTVMTIFALAVLVSLGRWQLHRLQWKTALLNRLSAGIEAPAIAYDRWLAERQGRAGSGEFDHVKVRGTFDYSQENYVFTTRDGKVGYLVFTALRDTQCSQADAACTVWIDRGFVPEGLRDPGTRQEGEVKGEVEVSGLMRLPEKAGWFTPEPDRDKRIWYAATFPEPYYIEADATPNPGGWPKGRDPKELLTSIPNSHAQYAFTWFSLAVVLLIVYGFYMRSRLATS